jgi:histidinol phosphatase-like PHP family hydrolase
LLVPGIGVCLAEALACTLWCRKNSESVSVPELLHRLNDLRLGPGKCSIGCMKNLPITRRAFLGSAAAAGAFGIFPAANGLARAAAQKLDFPLQDLHVHLDNSTIDEVAKLSRERGIKFGIVEHAGTKENVYPVVLSNDEELNRYLAMLDGKQVYKGIQAEWTDWMHCFSREALSRLDFVLTDAWTFPGKDGTRVKLFTRGFEDRVDFSDKQAFMDRFVDWHVQIMAGEPIDILANVSWLPAPLAADFDQYWTTARMQKVIDAAAKYQVALEIGARLQLPKPAFLKRAKAAGVKFTIGSNGRYPEMGKLDYGVAVALELGLKQSDMFTPMPDGQKAVQRRKF